MNNIRVLNEKDIQYIPTSHLKEIIKKVFINKEAIPPVTQISLATLKPGQCVETHSHETMHEVYIVKKGTLIVNKKHVKIGEVVIIPEKCPHSVSNAGRIDVVWYNIGIATDIKK